MRLVRSVLGVRAAAPFADGAGIQAEFPRQGRMAGVVVAFLCSWIIMAVLLAGQGLIVYSGYGLIVYP
jgi:hypothetical protein